jgi:PTH1 family peptidyl-tRNA hydrolase
MGFRRREPVLNPTAMVVGLGNPGPQYAHTRHNVGFDLIELLAERHKVRVRESGSRALFGIGMVAGEPVVLVKPLTFMNRSGEAVGPLAKRWGIATERILVVADDLDLPLAAVRVRSKGGSGGHNGHKSLVQALGTQEYPRIRIGIGRGEQDTVEHVLDKFHPDERRDVQDALARTADAVECWLRDGMEAAMNRFNGSG